MQAEAMQLPHVVMHISAEPSYLEGYRAAIKSLKDEHGIDALATGMNACGTLRGVLTYI